MLSPTRFASAAHVASAALLSVAVSACFGSDGAGVNSEGATAGAAGNEVGVAGHPAVQAAPMVTPGGAGGAASDALTGMTIPPVPGDVMGSSAGAAGSSGAAVSQAGAMAEAAGMMASAGTAGTAGVSQSADEAGRGGAAGGGKAGEMDGDEETACQVAPITPDMRSTYKNMDDGYYQKYASANGIIVATGEKVRDEAVIRYCRLVAEMFSNEEIRQAVLDAKMWFTMISESEQLSSLPQINRAYGRALNARARGLGGLNPTICAEDSIMCKVGEPWYGDCICPHETGHTLYSSGIEKIPELSKRLTEITRNARASGRLANNYVWQDGNESGMMAWGVQAWYNCALEGMNGAYRTDINTRAELQKEFPDFYEFLSEILPIENKYQDCYAK